MGLIVLDAGVIIGVADGADEHHAAARSAIAAARDAGDDLVLPVAAYAEAAVHPHRLGEAAVVRFDQFVDALPIRVEAASRSIGMEAASLRARHGRTLPLPDALVVATARRLKADRIITTDAGWPDVGVPVTVLGMRDA